MINIEQTKDSLKISYFDKNGDVKIEEILINPNDYYEWDIVKDSKYVDKEWKNWDDRSVARKRTRYLNKYRIIEFLETQPQVIKDEIFQHNTPKKYFVDIEVEKTEDGYSNPDNPKGAIQTICIANEQGLVTILGTQQITDEIKSQVQKYINDYFIKYNVDWKFNYIYFKDEFSMLYSFFGNAMQKMPCVTGWNFVDFDWAYLRNRANKLGIDAAIASPTEKLDKNGMPLHKLIVDYLEVYNKWDYVVDVKESGMLNWVAETAVGIGKVKYNGSLKTLYENDYPKFLFYNAVDSILVYLIDKKLNTLAPFFLLGHLAHVEANRAFSPVAMVESLMVREFYKQKKVFVIEDNKSHHENYEGAFVMEPITGYHEDLLTFDYKSLYPTIMRQWNISPEVYLGKYEDIKDSYKEEDMIKCFSGAVFDKNKIGVLPDILTRLFAMRVEQKNNSMEVEDEITELNKYLKKKK